MKNNIIGSQIADNNSTVSNSKNKNPISIKRVKAESLVVGFIVGVLSSLLASYIYAHFVK